MKQMKKVLITASVIIALLFGWIIIDLFNVNFQEKRFYNVQIPDNLNFDKPIQILTQSQGDSLENIKVNKATILVYGSGYSGYDFFMWHKPIEKGEIFIKAYELTQNIMLSEWKLTNRTKNKITKLSNDFDLFYGRTVIDEGTFEHYYPVRFELWFKSDSSGLEKKLIEKSYVIDGWDR